MITHSTNDFKILKKYENNFLNADIDYKEFLNLNSDDEVLEDLYNAYENSKTYSSVFNGYYKQIFLEIEDYSEDKCLFILTISYSDNTNKFRVEITDMRANRVHNSNDDVFKLHVTSEPNKWLFNTLVKNGLFCLFNKCKEMLQTQIS